ncbi:MAG TPA: MG2 domain-containing protein [Myxococcales bacterium]|nr:MG2 domain-containing protein [Myxococcales bacterium]
MNRFALALLVLAACHKPQETPKAQEKALTEAPPPPALQLAPVKGAQPFHVAAARPKGKLLGAVHPTVTFSEPVVALESLGDQDVSRGIAMTPAVKGAWHWLGSSSVEFVNSEPFPGSTAFHVTIPAGLTALSGAKLQSIESFDFTTPAAEVQKYETDPGEFICKWSVPRQHFRVVVNQPLQDPAKAFYFDAKGTRIAAQVVSAVSLLDEQAKKGRARVELRQFGQDDLRIRYELAPAQDLPRDSSFAIALDPAAKAAGGDLPPIAWEQQCRVMGPMAITRVSRCHRDAEHCSRGPLTLDFENPLGPVADLRKRLHIEPAVALDWDESAGEDLGAELQENRTHAVLFGKFEPGKQYAVTIDEGVTDVLGQKAKAYTGTVQMNDLHPSLYVGQELALLEASGDGQLPAQVTNLAKLEAEIWSVSPAEMASLELCEGRANCGSAVPQRMADAPLSLNLDYPKNEPHLQAIDLRSAFKGSKTGLVVARLRAPGTDFADHPLRVLAQITDLAVHAKIGAVSSLAWVTSIQSGKGVAGAQVTVLGPDGAQLAEATTDGSGLATLPGYGVLLPKRRKYNSPRALVAASLGTDLGYAVTDEFSVPDVPHDYEVLGHQGLGLVFADRGIYRPGDTVHVKGIIRDQQAGKQGTPAGSKLAVKIVDPDGKDLKKETVTLSRYGTFTLDAQVPKDARLGNFSIETSSGAGSFLVAEYRAPQFRVDVQVAAAEQTAGESLSGNVIARYLFGAPMQGAQAQWSATRSTEDFAPAKSDGFRFGKQTWNWDDNHPAQDNGSTAAGNGVIGKDGTLRVDAGKLEAPGDRTARYTLEAEVADVSRQRSAGRASVLVHPAAYYVGLGASALFAKTGEPLALPVITAKPNGDRVQAKVHVTALLRSWHSIKKRNFAGLYETLDEPVVEKVAECDVQTGNDPASCSLVLPKPGFHELRAESKDAQGRLALTTVTVYAVGGGFAAWQTSDGPKVEVVADKTSYEVGDTAHLLVKSPYPSCRALVSVEREGVSDARVLDLKGTAATIDVPVTEAMVPNVFVGVVLQRERVEKGGVEPGDDPGRPSMRLGYAQLNVGTGTKRLKVALQTPQAEYRPRQKVPVDLVVSDSAGHGVAAEIQLYAVDEAVLRLTSYTLPDPVASLFPLHGLAVTVAEPMNRLVRRQKFGEKGEVQPGGGGGLGPSGDVRSRFATTVLWQTLESDSTGKAHAELELPDNLTTFRIMAVAATDQDRFGGGETSIRVSLPLLVLPALPRLARVGDEFEAGVVLHSVKSFEVQVSAQISGAVEIIGEAQRTVSAEANVAKEVRFKFKATSAGPATFRFRAVAGELSDGVEQTIPVQLPVEMEAVAVAGDTNGKVQEGLVPPAGASGSLELSLSSTALGGMGEALNQLVEYPYGCLEQLSSRLVPFVARREVQRVFGEAATDDQIVTDTIAKIEALQVPNGGFLYWPASTCPRAWTSTYATLALSRAQELGYPVHPQVLARARTFLAARAAGQQSCPYDAVQPEERIFALQVLARMKKPLPSYYDELYALRDSLPLFSKAQLADAIAVGKGKREQATALLQTLLDSAKETPREVHFEEADQGSFAPFLNSDTRTTGMVLQTLVTLQPDHPYVSKIARYLSNVRKGGKYRNTQEAAYSLMGLAEVVRVREREAPDFVARVALGGKEIATADFKQRSLNIVQKKISLAEAGKGQLPLVFEVDGKGSLFYTALLRYAPVEIPKTARSEGIFVQRWFEPFEAKGMQSLDFAAGDLIRIRARVATPQERNYVAVEVPLPAGLEAIDTALATSRQQPRARDEESQEGEESEGFDATQNLFWSPFNYSEKRDDRVVYFADHLPPGVHTLSFVARATTPGKFTLKPARAEEMYSPEVFGRSEGGSFTVAAQRPLAANP